MFKIHNSTQDSETVKKKLFIEQKKFYLVQRNERKKFLENNKPRSFVFYPRPKLGAFVS